MTNLYPSPHLVVVKTNGRLPPIWGTFMYDFSQWVIESPIYDIQLLTKCDKKIPHTGGSHILHVFTNMCGVDIRLLGI